MKKLLLVAGTITVAGFLYACGGSSSSSSGGSGSGITTTVAAPAISATKASISTPADAAKTVNASKTLASSFASGSSFPSLGSLVGKPAAQAANGQRIISTVRDMRQRVSRMVEKQNKLGKQVAAAQSVNCTDGGTMTFDSASNPVVLTFTACKEGSEYQNGTITMPQALMGATSGSGGTLTVNLTTISYVLGGYTTKTHESALNMSMTVGSFNSTAGSASFSMNGSESSIDYTAGTSENLSFGNFSINMTESTAGSATTVSMTLDGSVSMDTFSDTAFKTIDTASGMTFQNLAIVESVNSAASTSSLTINGTYAIKTIPSCMDGTFVISTQNALTTNSSGVTTGQMTVNGVVIVFNADGTVTATINGTAQPVPSYATACSLSF